MTHTDLSTDPNRLMPHIIKPTGGASSTKKVYNVYAQPIDLDPTNQMPANPNQKPAPGQAAPLSTARVASGIPKGGTRDTWTYPSPQMFWNALTRKGKAEGAKEEDMEVVVAIHNNMNENTWRQVLAWERLHQQEKGESEGQGEGGVMPRLSRFMGKPDDLSPKAWCKSVLGCVALFFFCGGYVYDCWMRTRYYGRMLRPFQSSPGRWVKRMP